MPGPVKSFKKASLSCRISAFTLVEMLVVMGVLAILLAVTVPAFRGLNQSGARHAAVNNLMGVLDRARIMAVSDGKATYVAFYASRVPPAGANTDSTNGPWGRAYAIYQDKDNVSFVPEQKTPWNYLPAGMAFKVDGSQTMSVTNQVLVPNTDPSFPMSPSFATSGVTSLLLPYWKFDATGAVDEITLNSATQAGGSSATYLRALLFQGSLRADGTEASTQAGSTGESINSSVLEEVDVNPVTGRARYIVNSADNLVTPTPTPKSSPQS